MYSVQRVVCFSIQEIVIHSVDSLVHPLNNQLTQIMFSSPREVVVTNKTVTHFVTKCIFSREMQYIIRCKEGQRILIWNYFMKLVTKCYKK